MAKLLLIYVRQRAQPPRPRAMMDHYSSLCINNQYAFKSGLAKPKKSHPAKVPYFKVAVRCVGGEVGEGGVGKQPMLQ